MILCSFLDDIVEYDECGRVLDIGGCKEKEVVGPSPALSELNAGPKWEGMRGFEATGWGCW